MPSFDDRREALENKFAHDENLRFKAVARRNKLFGLWAAERLGRQDGDAYAQTVVIADFEEAGDADVIRKVAKDLEAGGVGLSETELRAKLDELMTRAAAEIAG